MVFAHCVPSKWHLRTCFKLLHTPQIHWNQCHIFHIFLYCIYFYIRNFSSVFPAYILVSQLPLGQAWTVRKTLTFALWITGTSSPAKLGASTRWQQKPHPTSLSRARSPEKKANFVPLFSTRADLVRFSRSSWEDSLPKEAKAAVIDRLSMSSICSV